MASQERQVVPEIKQRALDYHIDTILEIFEVPLRGFPKQKTDIINRSLERHMSAWETLERDLKVYPYQNDTAKE